ncbi:MAG: hypothetical protein ACOCUI_03270, partial [bacterium]
TASLERLETMLSKNENINLHIIYLLRDIKAYSNSARKNSKINIKKAAKQWIKYQNLILYVLKLFPKKNITIIRYENLCKNPENYFNYFQKHFDLNQGVKLPSNLKFSDNHIIGNRMRLKNPIQIKYNASWKNELSERDKKIIDDLSEKTRKKINQFEKSLKYNEI